MNVKLILVVESDGREHFMIRLSGDGKKGFKAIDPPFTSKEWQRIPKKRINQLKNIQPPRSSASKEKREEYEVFIQNRQFVKDEELRYSGVINDLIRLGNPFSISKVFDIVNGKVKSNKIPDTILAMYRYRIAELREAESYGNADMFNTGYLKFQKFLKDKDMLFNELDLDLILKYKRQLLKQDPPLSNVTVGVYLKSLKTIYRYAKKKGAFTSLSNPFLDETIFGGLSVSRRQKAIKWEDVNTIRKLRKSSKEGSDIFHACNYFMFGYLGGGINFADISRLTRENIVDGRLNYVRFKTRRKTSDGISATITDEMAEIISYYRKNHSEIGNPYLFPVLGIFHQAESQKLNRIKKVRTEVNQALEKVGKLIDSPIKITTYTWRHTFASTLKNKVKAPTEMIRELMDHKDLATTKAYLEQFPDEEKDKLINQL